MVEEKPSRNSTPNADGDSWYKPRFSTKLTSFFRSKSVLNEELKKKAKGGKNATMSKSDDIDKEQKATLSNKVQAKRAPYHSHVDTRFPSSDSPVIANFDSDHITIGAGVAIFHLATSRVIICRHSLKNFWFLPKGRRDASEDTSSGAEREGYEEVISHSTNEVHYLC